MDASTWIDSQVVDPRQGKVVAEMYEGIGIFGYSAHIEVPQRVAIDKINLASETARSKDQKKASAM